MRTCADWQDLLLDDLYGLLDEPEAQALREHLAECPACQAARDRATLEKTRITRAALAISEVSPFRIPDLDTADAAPVLTAPDRGAPAPSSRRSLRPLVWLIGSALAACVLLAAGLGYRHHLHVEEQTAAVRQLGTEIAQIDSRLAGLDKELQAE